MDGQLMLALGLNTRPFEEGITRATSMVTRLGSTITSALGIYGAVGVFREIISYTKNATNEYIKLEQVIARTNNLLKNEHAYSQQKLDILKKQREEYQKIGVSQLQTAEAQYQILSKYPNANNTYESLFLKAVMNKSAATGGQGGVGDVTQDIAAVTRDAAMAIQKASHGKKPEIPVVRAAKLGLASDELSALNKELGVIHSEHLSNIKEKNAIVVAVTEMMGKHYEGQLAATRAANPFTAITDALTPLRNELGKFGVEIATRAVPTIMSAITWLKDLFEANKDKITDGIVQLGRDVKAFVNGVKETSGFFKDFFKPLIDLGKAVFKTTRAFEALGVIYATYKVGQLFVDLFRGFNKLKDFLGGSLKATAVMNVNANIVNVNGGLGGSSGSSAAGAEESLLAMAGTMVTAVIAVGTIALVTDYLGRKYGWFGSGQQSGNRGLKDLLLMNSSPEELARREGLNWGGKGFDKPDGDYENNFNIERKAIKDWGGIAFVRYDSNGMPLKNPNGGSNGPKPMGLRQGITNSFFTKPEAIKHLENIEKNTKPNPGQEVADPGQRVGDDVSSTTVKGESARQIIINIHDGLINHFSASFASLKEGADKIEEVIATAILNGIKSGEMLSNGGH